MELAAVILAGGTGARLGGADKAAIEYAGTTLLERALAATAAAVEVVVVARPGADQPTVTFVREDPAYGGPVAGLLAGRAALAGAPDLLLVLAVDMPHVTDATVARLAAAVGDADGAVLTGAGRPAPAGVRRPHRTVSTRSRRPIRTAPRSTRCSLRWTSHEVDRGGSGGLRGRHASRTCVI